MGAKAGREPVDFLTRFTASEQFEKVFREGMGLVEETANYLDGPGRKDARLLDRNGAIAYATESMRLTTRLMQLASWLLLQRAISAGELSPDDARKEKHRISLGDIGPGHSLAGSEQLPEALDELGRAIASPPPAHHETGCHAGRQDQIDGAIRKPPHRTARSPGASL